MHVCRTKACQSLCWLPHGTKRFIESQEVAALACPCMCSGGQESNPGGHCFCLQSTGLLSEAVMAMQVSMLVPLLLMLLVKTILCAKV